MWPNLFDLLPVKACCRAGWMAAGALALIAVATTSGCLYQRAQIRAIRAEQRAAQAEAKAKQEAAKAEIQRIEAQAEHDRERLLADLPQNATTEQAVAWALRNRRKP